MLHACTCMLTILLHWNWIPMAYWSHTQHSKFTSECWIEEIAFLGVFVADIFCCLYTLLLIILLDNILHGQASWTLLEYMLRNQQLRIGTWTWQNYCTIILSWRIRASDLPHRVHCGQNISKESLWMVTCYCGFHLHHHRLRKIFWKAKGLHGYIYCE